MSEQGVTTKEISPGVVLHKRQIASSSAMDPSEITYVFEVEVKKLQTLEFTADFTGSENIQLEGKSVGDLVSTVTIQPYSKDTIAVLRLMRDWRLKSRFRFTMRAPSREVQLKYIRDDVQDLQRKCQVANQKFRSYPINVMPVDEISKLVTDASTSYVDVDFYPRDESIYSASAEQSPMDTLVHWRRPVEFFEGDDNGNKNIDVFFETIEPNDIKQGALGDCWFMSALASLAERPALVERLFITKEYNQNGVYRVKLCKNGEWVSVTIDDFFPCYPKGSPIFSRAQGNELWVLLLEKAYAKLHGNYLLLRGGFASEGMIDLTGCPCASYVFSDDNVQELIQNGSLWELLKQWDEDGFLISASTHGEDRWTEGGGPDEEGCGLVPGHAYTVLLAKEARGNKLLNIRNPWGNFEWNGDWSDKSALWSKEMIEELNPVLEDDDGTFWMSYEDFLKNFRCSNICKVKNWDEVRIKGKFIRVQDLEDPNIEVVMSKWYYSLDVQERSTLVIGVHQEDERINGVLSRRPYLDIGCAILKRNSEGSITLVAYKDLICDRQAELEVTLDPGSYIILPRTTGCTLRRMPDAPSESIKMITDKGELHELIESTISDIFRKFDMLLNRELSYTEFKGFCECINKHITEHDFRTTILEKYCSSNKGLSYRGFLDFWQDSIEQNGEEKIWKWFEALGYDRDLYSIRSRCFILTVHGENDFAVTVRNAIQTDLDNQTNILLIKENGTPLEGKKGIRAFHTFSKAVHGYSYGVINDHSAPIEATLDCSKSEKMLFSGKTGLVKKRIEPGQLEFMMHAMALPSADTFVRSAKCTWQPTND
eukprot:CAMPEP_0115030694 /NCGR_PEP_ID=MMETSP0216-20121206/37993_1 /TAXON_ID=223996 /ORGANISM="Protocruzia adherens, Strain Boccale" /LENGTH=823 /DNA_ID=CAMNT_0002408007 /DNA_START=44 /DNA_END=2515 /DNA_ORIENTATION=+